MTNHWADIANATLVVAWGANPAENHPACMAHVNRARFPGQYDTGSRASKMAAKLIVVDPRKTRTALQADNYIRIRPGTDIAFQNGVLKYMIDKIDGLGSGPVYTAFYGFLNQTGNGTFWTDGQGAGSDKSVSITPSGCSKYTDARFLLPTGNDLEYDRETINAGTSGQISDFPKKSTSCTTGNTVFNRLKAHLAHYTAAVVADICDCETTDIALLGDAIIENSRCSSAAKSVTYTDLGVKLTGTAAQPLWATNVTVASVKHLSGSPTYTVGTDYSVQGPAGTITRIGGAITDGQRVLVTYTGTTDQAPSDTYRATTILYAMGITQHTCGSQNIKGFANLQSIMGNMGRAGGGINALRGIHNVQGSTDMGLLYGNIPGYSGNPGTQVDAIPSTNNAFGKYMDTLWGSPLSGTSGRLMMTPASWDDAYVPGNGGLQQRGFYNMTLKWFGDATMSGRTGLDTCYSLWPKGNGSNHVKMFREMASGVTKAAVVWGQNPANTEPNQSKVREGLAALDLLVVTDMFQTETAACDRKDTGVTYLIPACSHVEKAGSATNSGRTLQWRYKAADPLGNSKDDIELLLRFAKALNDAQCFSHIENAHSWTSGSAYSHLYDSYGWNPSATIAGVSSSTDYKTAGNLTTGGIDYATPGSTVSAGTTYAAIAPSTSGGAKVQGSEYVAEMVFREWASNVGVGGTIWLYTEGYDSAKGWGRLYGGYDQWKVSNRAKSRDREDPYGTLAFHKWGYSWLVNRRVFYNNAEVIGDQADYFMGPDSCVRLLAPNVTQPAWAQTGNSVYNYSRWYRTSVAPTKHVLSDKPLFPGGGVPTVHVVPGRFPSHVEPYESPRPDLVVNVYGQNSTLDTAINPVGAQNLVYSGTEIGTFGTGVGEYPLVLTTIRCVEHFQGGPTTRNNWFNVELEPEPWIELNSADAGAAGIRNGDHVRVITARTEDFPGHQRPDYGDGFVARVGAGLSASQKVAAGVVAIPWHWGEQGLSTGSRANDLTIDAMDANSTIPEYKACLCRIERI